MSTHIFVNHTVDPSAPAVDRVRVYAKADGFFMRDSSGAVRRMDAAAAAPLQAKQSSTVMTTSATDVAVPGASLTVSEIGTYTLNGNIEVFNDGANDVMVSVYNNGAMVTDSERTQTQHSHGAFDETSSTLSFDEVVVVAAPNDVVELRWRVTGGTATSRGRSIVMQKVS